MKTKLQACAAVLFVSAGSAYAASRADVHIEVFSSGFLTTAQRQVTYGDQARRTEILMQGKGTASGEANQSRIEIDRLVEGLSWVMDPKSKTYQEFKYTPSRSPSEAAPDTIKNADATIRIASVDTQRSVALGTATINGFPSTAYVLRLTAKFVNPQTGKAVATETLIEKLWVTENAPELAAYRDSEDKFEKALGMVFGVEKANFRWLLREFNKSLLELNGNPEDFKTIQKSYREARAQIKGVTVRQLAGWNWRVVDPKAPGTAAPSDIHTFIAAIASGLGAPPDTAGQSPLSPKDTPRWVQDLSKDLGRNGPTAMILEEVTKVKSVSVKPDDFEVPVIYRKQ
jgi:hypothetical protein